MADGTRAAGHARTACLLLVLVFLPGAEAAACHSQVVTMLAQAEATIQVDVVLLELDAARLRTKLDREYGNGNGVVDETEEAAFIADWARIRSAPRSACLADDPVVRREQAAPEAVVLRSIDIMIGPRNAGATEPVEIRTTTRLAWPEDERDRASYSLDLARHPTLESTVRCIGGRALDPPVTTSCRELPAEADRGATWHVLGQAGRLDTALLAAAGLGGLVDNGSVRAVTALDEEALLASDAPFVWLAPESPAPWPALAVAGGLVVIAAGIWAWAREGSRYAILRTLATAVAGSSRISRKEAEGHPRREAILETVRNDPGVHLTEVGRRLGLGSGTLVHHVRTLERHGLLRVVRDGRLVRLTPVDQGTLRLEPHLTAVQGRLLDAVHARPGLTQGDLSVAVGAPRGTVRYNVDRLVALGLLRVERRGVTKHHYARGVAPSGSS